LIFSAISSLKSASTFYLAYDNPYPLCNIEVSGELPTRNTVEQKLQSEK
jgi:hypothetical protein